MRSMEKIIGKVELLFPFFFILPPPPPPPPPLLWALGVRLMGAGGYE